MEKLLTLNKIIKKWIEEKKWGNISIKGTLLIDKSKIPVDAQINFVSGDIQSIKLTETVFFRK